VFPTNSPKEEDWLQSELSSGGDRGFRVLSTPEYGRNRAKNFTDGCAEWLNVKDRYFDKLRFYAGLARTFFLFESDSAHDARKNSIDAERFGFPFVPRDAADALLVAALTTDN